MRKTPSNNIIISDVGSSTLHIINKNVQLLAYLKVATEYPFKAIKCIPNRIFLGTNFTDKRKEDSNEKLLGQILEIKITKFDNL